MGYRSDGAIYLPQKAYFLLPDKLKQDLKNNWHKDENIENVWNFYDWKWYDSFDDIKDWENFMRKLNDAEEEYDFIRLGEDINDSEVRTYEMFYINRTIGYS